MIAGVAVHPLGLISHCLHCVLYFEKLLVELFFLGILETWKTGFVSVVL